MHQAARALQGFPIFWYDWTILSSLQNVGRTRLLRVTIREIVRYMEINRADSQAILAVDRNRVLAEFGIAHSVALAIGSEAEVYAIDHTTVLKLYANPVRLRYFETLRDLYASVDAQASLIRLPQILEVTCRDNLVVVLETRLAGEPFEAILPNLSDAALVQAEALYLDTVCGLHRIPLAYQPQTYLLFDDSRQSAVATQSFEAFYATLLKKKVASVSSIFNTLDPQFASRAAALVAAIRTASPAAVSLVHGDFFPGNLLMNSAADRVTGLIDFGSFTLFGNYLLDVAGAFSFYRMYHPNRRAIRASLLSRVLDRISQAAAPTFFQFVLANAILTSDLYLTDGNHLADGHFGWAAEIVAQDTYWQAAL